MSHLFPPDLLRQIHKQMLMNSFYNDLKYSAKLEAGVGLKGHITGPASIQTGFEGVRFT